MAAQAAKRKRWAVDRQQLLILLIAAVMMTSFVLLVLWPRQRELSDLDDALEHERGLVNQKVLASQEGVLVSARIPALRQAQAVCRQRLPAEPRVAEFLEMVARCLAAEPEVTHEVERADDAVTGPAPAVPVRLRLAGPFEAVYRCLAAIEGLERLNRFRRVSVHRAETPGQVLAEGEVLLFYLPDGQEAETASAGAADGAAVPREPQGSPS